MLTLSHASISYFQKKCYLLNQDTGSQYAIIISEKENMHSLLQLNTHQKYLDKTLAPLSTQSNFFKIRLYIRHQKHRCFISLHHF